MTKTYCAARAISIQSRAFEPGEVIGTGDVSQGAFTAAEGCERFVELHHVLPRLADGRIVEQPPAPEPPASPKPRARATSSPKAKD